MLCKYIYFLWVLCYEVREFMIFACHFSFKKTVFFLVTWNPPPILNSSQKEAHNKKLQLFCKYLARFESIFWICLEAPKLGLNIFKPQTFCFELSSAVFICFLYLIFKIYIQSLNLNFKVHNNFFLKFSKLHSLDFIFKWIHLQYCKN